MKLKNLLIIVSTCVLTACGSKMAGGSIDVDDIDSVIITKRNLDINTDSSKRLPNNLIAKFADKWNSSSSSGPMKFIIEYELTVYFKNNQQKTFGANGKNVKEKNDWCVDFNDSDFFDNLWLDKNLSN